MSDISVTERGARVVRVDLGLAADLGTAEEAQALGLLVAGAEGDPAMAWDLQLSCWDIWWFEFHVDLTPHQRQSATELLVERLLGDVARCEQMPRYPELGAETQVVELAFLPGVTDPEVEAMVSLSHTLLPEGQRPSRVMRGRHVRVIGLPARAAYHLRRLANPAIERFSVNAPLAPWAEEALDASGAVARMAIGGLDDAELMALSTTRRLSLDLAEMRAIAAHFAVEGREISDVELETLAQTWSEHCKHKTFRALIDYTETTADGSFSRRVIDGLLPTCFSAVTAELARPYVRSAFVDNAGVVAFDADFDLAIKVETHNRPSAIEPFGGANTGLGGVLRDIMGVSARPFASLDVLFFGPEDYPPALLPAGAFHPVQVRRGVVRGIGDYGNKMGIPTVAGGVRFDDAYVTNPLVFAGAVGIVPRGAHPTRPRAGDLIVVAGGATGRDGLRGATFSSVSMDATTGVVSGGAVQIGHPIMEKRLLDFQIEARDARLYHAVTDCGAGGLSSAVGELAEGLGAEVELADVTSKYLGLAPWELWLSEAQERMVLAVPPEHLAALQALAVRWGCPVAVIGAFSVTGRLRLRWRGGLVADLELAFLHEGLPRRTLMARWEGASGAAAEVESSSGAIWESTFRHLSSPNGRLAREIIATYDTEVQGGTLARPVVGASRLGAGDGAVVMPVEFQHLEMAPSAVLGIGFCPELTRTDPRLMAWWAIDEAIRNVVAVGADPDRLSLLDNFAWGDTHNPRELGALARAAEACAEAARFYRAPFVSGKDSLHNAWTMADGTRRSIPGTLVITALGTLAAGQDPCTSDFKEAGDIIAHVGFFPSENKGLPQPDTLALYRALHSAHRLGLLSACHDVSSGGLLAAIAEMALGGMLGATLHLDAWLAGASENALRRRGPARFIVTFAPAQREAVAAVFGALPLCVLGHTAAEPALIAEVGGRVDSRSLRELGERC